MTSVLQVLAVGQDCCFPGHSTCFSKEDQYKHSSEWRCIGTPFDEGNSAFSFPIFFFFFFAKLIFKKRSCIYLIKRAEKLLIWSQEFKALSCPHYSTVKKRVHLRGTSQVPQACGNSSDPKECSFFSLLNCVDQGRLDFKEPRVNASPVWCREPKAASTAQSSSEPAVLAAASLRTAVK